ncbi:hypothetical protein [Radiobacillus sp. PE A8.2]|uniref:hypothetical protein n=1 Tax=Radiobacillus sp. PE A8.2 TaxID=3380349 RepID=UPI003890AA63
MRRNLESACTAPESDCLERKSRALRYDEVYFFYAITTTISKTTFEKLLSYFHRNQDD